MTSEPSFSPFFSLCDLVGEARLPRDGDTQKRPRSSGLPDGTRPSLYTAAYTPRGIGIEFTRPWAARQEGLVCEGAFGAHERGHAVRRRGTEATPRLFDPCPDEQREDASRHEHRDEQRRRLYGVRVCVVTSKTAHNGAKCTTHPHVLRRGLR